MQQNSTSTGLIDFARLLSSVVLFALMLCGCGQKNSIDQVVEKESLNPYFGNGLFQSIRLPATVSPEQLTSNILNELGSVTNILEAREVRIVYKGMEDFAATNQE